MDWKKFIPHVVAIIIMALTAVLYCSPVIEGKVLVQDDIVKNIAQAKETRDYRAENGEEPLWTTRVFSGMTAFHIGTKFSTNVTEFFRKAVAGWLPQGANIIFAVFLGFYILQVVFGINPWLALFLSLAYGLSSNLTVSILAGHNTKVLSIAFMAPAIGGLLLALNGKRYLGALLVLFSLAIMIFSNHYQIMYYFLLTALVIGGTYLFFAIKEKTLPSLVKNASLIAAAGLIALLPNLGKVYNTYAHSKETIRGGKSELTSKDEKDKGGLDRGYAMSWSYGILETFTTVVPSFYGGASTEALSDDGNVADALKSYSLNKAQKQSILANAPLYIGDQPFLLGTVYFGAGFIFLFILSLFLLPVKTRSWIIGTVLLSLIISWGRHIEFITGFLFDYFPMYNKFRTPSMALAIAGFIIPFAGALGLHQIFTGRADEDKIKHALKYTMMIAGGMMLLLLLYGIMSDWIGPKDTQYQTKNSPWSIDAIYQALIEDRKSRYLTDWFIAAFIMAISGGIIYLFTKKKLALTTAVVVLGLAYTADMWNVSKRYLNEDAFKSEREYMAQFQPSPADQRILADPDPHYRVLNVTRNPWTDGLTCYHHKNIGGHHAAKLQRYQDLIENALGNQLQFLNQGLRQTEQGVFLAPEAGANMPVYNMLNTKYFILQNDNPAGVAVNPNACGNAWFVSTIKKVNSADEEMAALASFDPKSTAIVHADFGDELYNYDFGVTENAAIKLTSSSPKRLTYRSSNQSNGLAVFSEVYYENGWEAFVDGAPVEVQRVNYLLRAIKVPAGEHEIEMRFEPESFRIGMHIATAGSIIFLLFAAGMLWMYRKSEITQD